MRTVGVYLIFAAVVVRAAVVLTGRTGLPGTMALLAGYGLLLLVRSWLEQQNPGRYLQSRSPQVAYLILQSALVIGALSLSSYEDFIAMLFIPLSLDAVLFFGRQTGYRIIAGLSLAMIGTLLFSDVGLLFGLAMGILYSGICVLFGGYASQVQKAREMHARNERMLGELQAAHRALQGYADQKAGLAVEHERNRLARELHDSVTQTVFSMNLTTQSAGLLWDQQPPRAAGQLIHLEELAASALCEIQSLISQLRPHSSLEQGLAAALRRLALDLQAREGLHVSLEVQGEATLSDPVAEGLYAIAHEALRNVARHSGTCQAALRLDLNPDRACLEVEDHGRGFDPESVRDRRGHLGLASMSERARDMGGDLSVLSRPGHGTRVLVSAPPPGVGP